MTNRPPSPLPDSNDNLNLTAPKAPAGVEELNATTKTQVTASRNPPHSHPSPENQNLPARFGRYQLIRELGRGGMGAVVLAEDTQLGRQVALKIPFLKKTSDPRTLKRFEREAKSAASLSHPNLCPVYDFGSFEKWHFLSMAYIEGHSMQAYLDNKADIPQRTAAGIVRKIAQGLQHAHERGVIHRDLKPSNIMMEPNQGPIVTDFGLARCLDDDGEGQQLTQDGVAIGTPAYMSPEQLDGDSTHIGPPSDIFSLGLIFFEMLTGQRRFQGKVTGIIGKILTKDATSLREIKADVDPELDLICQKMMARDVSKRYATMEQVAEDLKAYLKGELSDVPVAHPVASPAPRAAVAPEMPSDPEAFFADLAGLDHPSAAGSPTHANPASDPTQPNLVPPIVISDDPASRSSHRIPTGPRSSVPRQIIFISASCMAVLLLGMFFFFGKDEKKAPPNKPQDVAKNSSRKEEKPKPAPVPQPNPDLIANVDKPMDQPAKKTERVIEPKPFLKPIPKPDPKPEPMPDPKPGPDPKPEPMPDPKPEPKPVPMPAPIPDPPAVVALKEASGKLEFQGLVSKTINTSTTEKKFKTPRLAMTEIAKLERREEAKDKALKVVRTVIELNGNTCEFDQAKTALEAVEALDEALRENILIEDILAKFKYLNPKFADPPEKDIPNDLALRLNKEFQTINDTKVLLYLRQLNNGRGPQSQLDIDGAQAYFEEEARKIKDLPKTYPLPKLPIELVFQGSFTPKTYYGDSERYKERTPSGKLIRRVADALNAGKLIATPAPEAGK